MGRKLSLVERERFLQDPTTFVAGEVEKPVPEKAPKEPEIPTPEEPEADKEALDKLKEDLSGIFTDALDKFELRLEDTEKFQEETLKAIQKIQDETGQSFDVTPETIQQAAGIFEGTEDTVQRGAAIESFFRESFAPETVTTPTAPTPAVEGVPTVGVTPVQESAAVTPTAITNDITGESVSKTGQVGGISSSTNIVKQVEETPEKPYVFDFNFSDINQSEFQKDLNSAEIIVNTALSGMSAEEISNMDQTQTNLAIEKFFRETGSSYEQAKKDHSRYQKRANDIRKQQQIDSVDIQKEWESSNLFIQEERDIMNGKFAAMESKLEESAIRNKEELVDSRDKMEAYINAQMAFGGLGSISGAKMLISKLSVYDKKISDVETDYSQNVQDLFLEQRSTMLQFAKLQRENDQDALIQMRGLSSKTQDKLFALEEKGELLESEKIEEKNRIMSDFATSISTVVADAQKKTDDNRKATEKRLDEAAKALSTNLGIVFTVQDGEIVPLTYKGKTVTKFDNIQKQLDKLPNSVEKESVFNAWKFGYVNALNNQLNIGAITKQQFDDNIKRIEGYETNVLKPSWASEDLTSYYGSEDVKRNILSNTQNNIINQLFTKQSEDPSDADYMSLAENCVFFARRVVPGLPAGLNTEDDKIALLSNPGSNGVSLGANEAVAGSVAIIDVKSGEFTNVDHTAVVEKVNPDGTITIVESHWDGNQITRRTGTPEQLNVRGYWADRRIFERVQAQKEASLGTPLANQRHEELADLFSIGGATAKNIRDTWGDDVGNAIIKRGWEIAGTKQVKDDQLWKYFSVLRSFPTKLADNVQEAARIAQLVNENPDMSVPEIMLRFAFGDPEAEISPDTINIGRKLISLNSTLPEEAQLDPSTLLSGIRLSQGFETAVAAVENSIVRNTFDEPGGTAMRQRFTEPMFVIDKARIALDIIEGNPEVVGKVQGLTSSAFAGLGMNEEDAINLETQLKLLASDLGITEDEFGKFSISQGEKNLISRLNTVVSNSAREISITRSQAGLPELTIDEIMNPDLKMKRYIELGKEPTIQQEFDRNNKAAAKRADELTGVNQDYPRDGEIRVRLKKAQTVNGETYEAGKTGIINEEEFDPNLYEKI